MGMKIKITKSARSPRHRCWHNEMLCGLVVGSRLFLGLRALLNSSHACCLGRGGSKVHEKIIVANLHRFTYEAHFQKWHATYASAIFDDMHVKLAASSTEDAPCMDPTNDVPCVDPNNKNLKPKEK
ncbi:unnamed protein product [Prunus armeniaca]